MKNKKSLQNISVIVFDENRNICSIQRGVEIVSDSIETSEGIMMLSDAKIFTDEWNGHIYYIFNLDLPSKVEAENLKRLRRSTAVHNIFSYDTAKPFDFMKLLPYLIIIMMILFMK